MLVFHLPCLVYHTFAGFLERRRLLRWLQIPGQWGNVEVTSGILDWCRYNCLLLLFCSPVVYFKWCPDSWPGIKRTDLSRTQIRIYLFMRWGGNGLLKNLLFFNHPSTFPLKKWWNFCLFIRYRRQTREAGNCSLSVSFSFFKNYLMKRKHWQIKRRNENRSTLTGMYATELSVCKGICGSQIMGGAKLSPNVRRQLALIYLVVHVTTINKEVARYQPQLNQRDEQVYVSIIAASESYHEHVRNVNCNGLAQDVASLLKINPHFGFCATSSKCIWRNRTTAGIRFPCVLVNALVDLSAVLIQMHDITVVNSHAAVDKTLY